VARVVKEEEEEEGKKYSGKKRDWQSTQ